jgi:hypothetical protein
MEVFDRCSVTNDYTISGKNKPGNNYLDGVIVIYITNAVGYILQCEVFRLKHDRAA